MLTPLTTSHKRPELFETLTPLERAKVDLVSAFAVNALAFLWVKTKGKDPKDTEVRERDDH